MLRLVVNPHVVGDVSGRQQLPADVTGNLLLVPDQVRAQTVPRRKRRRARLQEGNRKSEQEASPRRAGSCDQPITVHLKGRSVECTCRTWLFR